MDHTSKNLEQIFASTDRKKFVLPDFQRGFVWDRADQRAFLCSFLVKLPIGSLLLLEGAKEDFACRDLCVGGDVLATEDCQFVLDGQQRLSTARSAFYDIYKVGGDDVKEWKTRHDAIYPKLQNRWCLRVTPTVDEEDIFGWRMLRFPGLDRYEQSHLEDFLECRRVTKKNISDWFHPGFQPVDSNKNPLAPKKAELKKVSMAAGQGVVPLFDIERGTDGMHHKVLTELAQSRAREIEAEFQDKKNTVEDYENLFDGIVDDISERFEDVEKMREAWNRLALVWQFSFAQALDGMLQIDIPIIQLPSREVNRAVAIFEALNRGGTKLSVYDLVVARAASDRSSKSLTHRVTGWLEKSINVTPALVKKGKTDKKQTEWCPSIMDALDGVEPAGPVKDWFLNLLSLIVATSANRETSHDKKGKSPREGISVSLIKKDAILKLSAEAINSNAEAAASALARALAFLMFRIGVIKVGDVPYKLMLLPLALALKEDKVWKSPKTLDRLEAWYWVSFFSGRYQLAQNERCIDDIRSLPNFLNKTIDLNDRRDQVLENAQFGDRALLLGDSENEIPSALRKGILQWLLSRDLVDLLDEKQPISTAAINSGAMGVEVHHVVPLATAKSLTVSAVQLRKQPDHILNSPLNLTYLTTESNRKIRDLSPDKYFEETSAAGRATHSIPNIDGDTLDQFRKGNYKKFLGDRFELIRSKLLEEVQKLIAR